MRIVISEFMDEVAVDRLRATFGKDAVLYDATLVDRSDDMAAAVSDCEVFIVRNRTQVRGALLDVCKSAKVIGRLGVGLDNIDVPLAKHVA